MNREHRRGLLAHEFRIVVLVEFVQLHQRPRQPRLAANLTGAQRAEQVQDFVRRHTHRVEAAMRRHRREHPVAGMAFVQVIGDAHTDAVELDAGADDVAVGQLPIQRRRQVLGFEQLQLQTDRQPIFRPPVAQPHQALAAFEHRPARERLQAVQIRQARRVRLLAPVAPQRLHRLALVEIGEHRLRLDPGTDGVRDERLDAGRGPDVAADQIAALGAQFILRIRQRRDRAGIADLPEAGTSPAADAVVSGRRAEHPGAQPRPPTHAITSPCRCSRRRGAGGA